MCKKLQVIDEVPRANVHTYLFHMIPFNSGSASARVESKSQYVVYSYDTVIGRVALKNRDVLYFDPEFYSKTTSFIQNEFRKVFFEIKEMAPCETQAE